MGPHHHLQKPGCSGNARQKALLRMAGYTLDVCNLLSWPWTAARYRAFMAPRPISEWFKRAAPRIKSSEVVPETVDANVALALLLAEPLLFRRSLMQCDERRMVGSNAALVYTWIGLGAHAPAPDMLLEDCAAMTEHSSHQRAIRCAPST
ncbi:nitrogenase-associated protein [Paraburkholderia sp. BL6669N2]|uniref:hypothetical protein n=1 Tax=Paraburkholderia sp. BL6669N2 TaxID=1938807 RepID=UPI000E2644C3|nr:hypothetical protein [Paraburkholderia sp. BL6669N2]REG58695.1 nitrogenase-associated protein [Paraburkholderia sp. BL6669N2]